MIDTRFIARARRWAPRLPRLWHAAAIDFAALGMLRCFFRMGDRPHFRTLPDGWLATEGVYSAPALRDAPGDFFASVPPTPRARSVRVGTLPAGERLDVRFASAYRTFYEPYQRTYDSFTGNETVHARVWRHDGAPRPTVICLHGWAGGTWWLEEQIFGAMRLYQAGLNVAIMALPFHGPRRPVGRFAFNLFPSSDLRRTNEGFGQAICDAQALLSWLLDTRIASRVGVVGMSLGGYVTALWAGLDARLDFAAPVIAPSSLADLLWEHGLDRDGAHAATRAGFNVQRFREAMAVHTPLKHPLRLPRHRVLLVGGRADGVVPPTQIEALHRHWGRPPLLWFDGGHYLHFGRSEYLERIIMLAGGARLAAEPHGATSGAWFSRPPAA